MLIPIERGASETVSRQIVQYLRRAIEAGRLRPGTKLEPIRQLARELGINRETVAAAYHELEVRGLSESTVGRGTFVRVQGTASAAAAAPSAVDERPLELVFARRCASLLAEATSRVDYTAAAN